MHTQLWQGHGFFLQNVYLEDLEEEENMDLTEIIVTNEVTKKTFNCINQSDAANSQVYLLVI
jgi:hypothetical protein